jgi:prepilin-type N-terminal cleavage/methylation domain-containing protein
MKELRSKGFSLLELLLVLMVLGLVAVAAIPGLSSSDNHRFELAAGEIAGAMRFARSEALRSGEPHGFQLQTSDMRIRVISADTNTNPWTPRYDVEHPGVHDFYDIQLADNALAGIQSMARNALFQGNCNNLDLIYFDASGTPWCGDGSGSLLEQYDVTLSFGAQSRVVSLHGITGRVTVQ